MAARTDIRIIVPLKIFNAADVELRDRISQAAKTLNVPMSELMRACITGGLDNPAIFHPHLRRKP